MCLIVLVSRCLSTKDPFWLTCVCRCRCHSKGAQVLWAFQFNSDCHHSPKVHDFVPDFGRFWACLQDYKDKVGEDPTKHFTDEELKERDRSGRSDIGRPVFAKFLLTPSQCLISLSSAFGLRSSRISNLSNVVT